MLKVLLFTGLAAISIDAGAFGGHYRHAAFVKMMSASSNVTNWATNRMTGQRLTL